jgi:hypothetical protein
MNCPRCEVPMSKGAPHSEGDAFQWECGRCGKCIGEPRGTDYLEPYRYFPMDNAVRRKP